MKRESLLSVMEYAAKCIPTSPVRIVASETTDRGGIVRLEYHEDHDGYALWFEGQIVWRSWE